MSYQRSRSLMRLSPTLPVACTSLLLAACAQGGAALPDLGLANLSLAPDAPAKTALTTGSVTQSPLPAVGEDDALANAAPADTATKGVLERARSLRQQGKKARAMALLQGASKKAPGDKLLLRERGLLAVEMGQLSEARELLQKAIDPHTPDWRTHSALGSALAAAGRHSEAQKQFATALELAPDHPSVLNNLALSYALDGKHERAETLLREAAQRSGNAKTKQNLALILGLKGRNGEARRIAQSVLPPEYVAENESYLSGLRNGNLTISRAPRPDAPKEVRAAQAAGN